MFRRNSDSRRASYTGVNSTPPPYSHGANPAAIAAAGAVGGKRSTSSSSGLSSAAAATALRTYSLTQGSIDEFQRRSSLTASASLGRSNSMMGGVSSLTRSGSMSGGGGSRASPASSSSNKRQSVTVTRTRNADRTMSLTRRTVSQYGSFQLIKEDTEVIKPPAPNFRKTASGSGNYASSVLSYESDLPTVSEEGGANNNNSDYTHSPARATSPRGRSRYLKFADTNNGNLTVKKEPPSRGASPIKSALKDHSASGSLLSVSDDGSKSRRHHHARVSFSDAEDDPSSFAHFSSSHVVDTPKSVKVTPKIPNNTASKPPSGQFQAAQASAKAFAKPSANNNVPSKRMSTAAAAAANVRHPNGAAGGHGDSDSGDSIYSDCEEPQPSSINGVLNDAAPSPSAPSAPSTRGTSSTANNGLGGLGGHAAAAARATSQAPAASIAPQKRSSSILKPKRQSGQQRELTSVEKLHIQKEEDRMNRKAAKIKAEKDRIKEEKAQEKALKAQIKAQEKELKAAEKRSAQGEELASGSSSVSGLGASGPSTPIDQAFTTSQTGQTGQTGQSESTEPIDQTEQAEPAELAEQVDQADQTASNDQAPTLPAVDVPSQLDGETMFATEPIREEPAADTTLPPVIEQDRVDELEPVNERDDADDESDDSTEWRQRRQDRRRSGFKTSLRDRPVPAKTAKSQRHDPSFEESIDQALSQVGDVHLELEPVPSDSSFKREKKKSPSNKFSVHSFRSNDEPRSQQPQTFRKPLEPVTSPTNGGFRLMSLRDNVPPPNLSEDHNGFRSRFDDSSSSDSEVAAVVGRDPGPVRTLRGNGKKASSSANTKRSKGPKVAPLPNANKIKNVFSPSHEVKYLVPKKNSSAAAAAAPAPEPPRVVSEAKSMPDFDTHDMLDKGTKKFKALRKLFRLND